MKALFALVVGALLALPVFFALEACGTTLTPAEQKQVDRTASTIAECQAEGRACKADGGTRCYGAYRACMTEGGL